MKLKIRFNVKKAFLEDEELGKEGIILSVFRDEGIFYISTLEEKSIGLYPLKRIEIIDVKDLEKFK